MNTSEDREETGGETGINMSNLGASTSTYTINRPNKNKSSIHTFWFLLHWVTNQLIQKGLGCSVIREIIG